MIKRRHVFHVAGYDPISPESQIARFRRSLSIFGKTWGIPSQISGLSQPPDGVSAWWDCETQGPNWSVHTTYELLRWDDLILRDFSRSMPSRLMQAAITLFDFIVSGTLFRYFKASWKYACFFLFPFVHVVLFALAAIAAGRWVSTFFPLTGFSALIVTLVVALPIFVGLQYWLGRRWPINHVLDDWIFARQFVHGERADMEARLEAFADKVIAQAQAAKVDEIVIVGHCLGAALVMDIVARALARDPDLPRHGPALCILTVGATIPKFALHPKGDRFRRAAQRIANEASIFWVEYQARDDAISFYRFNPVSLSRISRGQRTEKPLINRVQLHEMMQPETFKRNRFNFMRLHYQFVMANDKRSRYDFFIIICGPLPFKLITTSQNAVDSFGSDGSLIDSREAATQSPMTVNSI